MELKCIAIIVIAASIKHARGSECTRELSESPDDCCTTLPMFAEEQVFHSCNVTDSEDATVGMENCLPFGCVMDKANLRNPDGTLSRDAIVNALKRAPADWHGIIDSGMITCFDSNNAPPNCKSLQFTSCIFGHLLKNCPENKWLQTPGCIQARSYVNNCM